MNKPISQQTTPSTQLEALKNDLHVFLTADIYNEELSQADENVKLFVQTMKNYAKVHTHAFITLCEAGNFLAAHHFVRLLSDCLQRTFCATLMKEEKRLNTYLKKFFKGKDPKDTIYKGKHLNPEYIKELMKQRGMDFDIFQTIGNESTHPKNFYLLKNADISQKEIDDFCGFMRYPLSAIAAQIYTLLH